jgi:hypothetical protein
MFGPDPGEPSEFEKLARQSARETAHERAEAAWSRLERGDSVRTPDGWTGFISEKDPNGFEVYVENWERAGTYMAHRVEVLDR